jgi:protein-S-isoprenylcysteine O-methyltransferase Ste14
VLASLALLLERYVLSAFFLYYAWAQWGPIRAQIGAVTAPGAVPGFAVPGLVQHVLVLIFDVQVGVLLLLSRKPAVPPRSATDVLVPLASNFFYLAYNLIGLAPAVLTVNRVPQTWRLPVSVLALYLSLAGVAIATWAVAHLGRSFGVLVAVRPLVTSGPYRHVRHPIYSSYVLQMGALVAGYGSVLVVALVAAYLALLVWRARLEEARLAEHSPEYRAYAAGTPFLFPGLATGRR